MEWILLVSGLAALILGAEGLVQPLELSITDHEGGGAGKILQWDGEAWHEVSNGWVNSDRDLLLPLIYERAAAYAAGQKDTEDTED